MNISPNEAEEALAVIQSMTQKTRHSVAASGIYIYLFVTGIVWLVGFLATQFLSPAIIPYIWIGLAVFGSVLSTVLGVRLGRRVRRPANALYGRRIGLFWLLLALYACAAIAVASPTDGKQLTMLIILFVMFGQLAMGLLFSFTSTGWVIPTTVLALIGYFLLPGLFYLWMGVLVGGSMIGMALYMRWRW